MRAREKRSACQRRDKESLIDKRPAFEGVQHSRHFSRAVGASRRADRRALTARARPL
jgi:hypothetical protein